MESFEEFQARKNRREVARLVSTATQEGVPDRRVGDRAATRFAAGMKLDVTVDPQQADSVWPVTMHNISDSGFSFWS